MPRRRLLRWPFSPADIFAAKMPLDAPPLRYADAADGAPLEMPHAGILPRDSCFSLDISCHFH